MDEQKVEAELAAASAPRAEPALGDTDEFPSLGSQPAAPTRTPAPPPAPLKSSPLPSPAQVQLASVASLAIFCAVWSVIRRPVSLCCSLLVKVVAGDSGYTAWSCTDSVGRLCFAVNAHSIDMIAVTGIQLQRPQANMFCHTVSSNGELHAEWCTIGSGQLHRG